MHQLEYSDEAGDKLDFIDDHDPVLGAALDQFFARLEADPHSFAHNYLRPPGAYVSTVRVPGRDDEYLVLWQFEPDDIIFVKLVWTRRTPT